MSQETPNYITIEENRFSPDKLKVDENLLNSESWYFEGYWDKNKINNYKLMQDELIWAFNKINWINNDGQKIERKDLYIISQKLNELFSNLVEELKNTNNNVVWRIEKLWYSKTKEEVLSIIEKQGWIWNALPQWVNALTWKSLREQVKALWV